jgi:hypothetical protein
MRLARTATPPPRARPGVISARWRRARKRFRRRDFEPACREAGRCSPRSERTRTAEVPWDGRERTGRAGVPRRTSTGAAVRAKRSAVRLGHRGAPSARPPTGPRAGGLPDTLARGRRLAREERRGKKRTQAIRRSESPAQRLLSGSMSRLPEGSRCCSCHSPTLRPWIVRREPTRLFDVLRGGELEPGVHADPYKPRLKQRLLASLVCRRECAEGPFSLRRGLTFDQSFFKLGITSRSVTVFGSRTRKGDPSGRPRVSCNAGQRSSAHTSQRGSVRNASSRVRSPASAGTSSPGRQEPSREAVRGCCCSSALVSCRRGAG